ncbi:hypothetical protein HPB49_001322 [Dermacentor silvarum]|uniref:Uncharacterized protein n=1 Tax=Dermacentor silvarum TaxID=543639 RepID=A0ACB8D1Z9_DERSI|nr:hypothetical protein HPB49_001322 [Dermacentor silvarum]
MQGINPFHKVPTLDDSGFVVYESIAIAYYLLRKYAPKSELYPECVKERTRIDQILAAVSSTIQPHKMAFFMRFFNKAKFQKLSSYYERVLPEIAGYDEIFKPAITLLQERMK